LLATKSDLDESHASVGLCYALVCKNAFYSIDDTSIALPPAIANLLQEYMDVFPSEIPPGLPPELPLDFQVSPVTPQVLPWPWHLYALITVITCGRNLRRRA
jgi:hypothetical protein